MADGIMLYPSLSEELLKKIRFQKKRFSFYYTDDRGDEYELIDEAMEESLSTFFITDENGVWTQDDYNFCFRRRYCLRTFNCLFGENGIACRNALLGLAVVWTSADSKQRGVVLGGTFCCNDDIFDIVVEKQFAKAQLRGEITFSTVIYLADAGVPDVNERHLADCSGYILGELDRYTVKLDGTRSVFPIFEISDPGQPLWYVKCDWIDPTTDSFSESVSITLNTAHKNYRYIDRSQKTFDKQLLLEIISSAISIIIEKVRLQQEYWEQVITNDDLQNGSVGQALYYFSETLEWDLSSPESVSLSVRKYFDQRM